MTRVTGRLHAVRARQTDQPDGGVDTCCQKMYTKYVYTVYENIVYTQSDRHTQDEGVDQ